VFQLEAIKNQIENKLNKNLRKKEERLKRELDDISGEDHTHTLETIEEDLVSVEQRTSENDQRSRGRFTEPTQPAEGFSLHETIFTQERRISQS